MHSEHVNYVTETNQNVFFSYRMQLEKAYKLCSPCKKVLQMKLHKEKETLLGRKLLENRSPEKKNCQKYETNKFKSFINNTSKYVATVLLILVSVECYRNMKQNNVSSTLINAKQILTDVCERIIAIIKIKMFMTFPSLENYLNDLNVLYLELPKYVSFRNDSLDHVNVLTQKALGGFVCLIQIIGHIWATNKLINTIIIDLLWTVFVLTTIVNKYVTIDTTIMSFIKVCIKKQFLIKYNLFISNTNKYY